MGNNACGCGSNNERQKPLLYEVPNEQWAEAVTSLNLAGVKMLHQEEPDLINECVSSQGYIAIQVAVKKQNFELFEYLLKYGGNINAPTGDDGNSCLHLAVINKDIKIISHLFAYDVDDTLYNNKGKTAQDLITDTNFRRNYIKIKNSTRHKIAKNQNYTNLIKAKSHLETTIGGVSVDQVSTNQLKQIMTGSGDDPSNLNGIKGQYDNEKIEQTKKRNEEMFRQKYVEISSRNSAIHLTEFGQDIGCEIDEIAYCVQHLNINDKLSKLWDKWVKKSKITKTHDLLKIIYGITVLTLRNRQKQNKYSSTTNSDGGDDDTNSIKPPSEPIKRLTSKVYKMLPRYKVESDGDNNQQEKPKKRKHVLTRNDFINNFHTYLYHAHEQFLNEQHQTNK